MHTQVKLLTLSSCLCTGQHSSQIAERLTVQTEVWLAGPVLMGKASSGQGVHLQTKKMNNNGDLSFLQILPQVMTSYNKKPYN